jgi:hypothetical protein
MSSPPSNVGKGLLDVASGSTLPVVAPETSIRLTVGDSALLSALGDKLTTMRVMMDRRAHG